MNQMLKERISRKEVMAGFYLLRIFCVPDTVTVTYLWFPKLTTALQGTQKSSQKL